MIELESSGLRLRLEPELGASILSLELRLRGRWVDLWRRAPLPLTRSGDAASFLLAPYSNRIRDGRFRFRGRTYGLRHAEKYAIHGDVRDRVWRSAERDGSAVRLVFDSGSAPDFNFPFPIRAETRVTLDGMTLVHGMTLENRGREAMPAGIGFHPYWMRALGDAQEDVELQLHVGGVYPGVAPVPMLPTGPPVPLAPPQDFAHARRLDVALDHCFAGWDGRATLRWPTSRVRGSLEASPALRHVVVYSPPGQPFFALEPVSHANDGFNLLEQGMAGTGVVVLEPGATLEGSFFVQFTMADMADMADVATPGAGR